MDDGTPGSHELSAFIALYRDSAVSAVYRMRLIQTVEDGRKVSVTLETSTLRNTMAGAVVFSPEPLFGASKKAQGEHAPEAQSLMAPDSVRLKRDELDALATCVATVAAVAPSVTMPAGTHTVVLAM